jgi:ATP-dependent DNA helicase RecG
MTYVATTPEQLASWMEASEDHHLEFKEAKRHYDFEELVRYCAALANEGGGRMILGITDKKPRRVVGTSFFSPPQRTEQGIVERLRLKVRAEEIVHPDGRVLVFHVPGRHLGVPVQYGGAYWMRSGESLVPMTPDQLRRIFDEAVPDFSAEIVTGARLDELSSEAIKEFRERWQRKSGNASLATIPVEQLLTDAELMVDGELTVAALILLGTRAALVRHKLAQAEVVFEYRSSESSIPYQQRVELRDGFFCYYGEAWRLINQRNDRQSYQDGLFRLEIQTFDEGSIREAILNAVAHRDYRDPGSVFIRQFPRRIEIVSPGGFPPGVSAENILDKQLPRNRRIAEAFGRCGLVERSGQGANRMFEQAIRQGKALPDFSGSDDHQVALALRGEIQNAAFIRYLERLGNEKLASFTTHDFLMLDLLQREQPIPDSLRPRLARLVELGAVERISRGRGTRYILSRSLYGHIGQKGTYTRKRGLDRETNKELLLKHLRDAGTAGSALPELMQVLPQLTRRQIWKLLDELRAEGRASMTGVRRGARWHVGPSESLNPKVDQ